MTPLRRLIRSVTACLLGILAACAVGSDDPSKPPARVPWTTSRVVGTPDPPPAYKTVNAFPNVKLDHPKAKEAFALGEKIFFFRGGPHDFACATCHAEDGKRIRLQDLPNLTKTEGAQKAYTTWPAYRVSQGELRTFQWRLNDCFRQQRFPELVFGSDASIALTAYLAARANGAPYDGPAIKR